MQFACDGANVLPCQPCNTLWVLGGPPWVPPATAVSPTSGSHMSMRKGPVLFTSWVKSKRFFRASGYRCLLKLPSGPLIRPFLSASDASLSGGVAGEALHFVKGCGPSIQACAAASAAKVPMNMVRVPTVMSTGFRSVWCQQAQRWWGCVPRALLAVSWKQKTLSGTPSTASAFQRVLRTGWCGAVCFGSAGDACPTPLPPLSLPLPRVALEADGFRSQKTVGS